MQKITWEEEKRLLLIKAIMLGECQNMDEAWAELGWKNDPMAVVFVESFDETSQEEGSSLYELLLYGGNSDGILKFCIDGREVLLLKGRGAVDKLNNLIYHYKYHSPQGNSPLGHFFVTYGHIAKNPKALNEEYINALTLMNYRFYYRRDVHICGPEMLPVMEAGEILKDTNELAVEIASLLQAKNKQRINDFIKELENGLLKARQAPEKARNYILTLFARMNLELQFDIEERKPIIDTRAFSMLAEARSLYEMMDIISSVFSDIIQKLGGSTGDGVINDVFYYVEHNYQTDLKLERIAYKFGYNSAYLGRLFKSATGKSFSSYVEKIRMEKACELLERGHLKVYEVAEKVGYNNVDYFHTKFQKYKGMSPAEYKKRASEV